MPQWAVRAYRWVVACAEAYGLLSSPFVTVFVLPGLISVGLAMMAYLDGFSRTHIYFAAVATFAVSAFGFASVAVGLLRITEWIDKNRVEGKLLFIGPIVSRDIDEENRIKALQLGVQLQNSAHFPMSYIVEEIRTSADSTLPRRGTINSWSGVIQPHMHEDFKDKPIDLANHKVSCDCKLEIKIRYGRADHEASELTRNLDVHIHHDPNKGTNMQWLHAPKNDAR